MRERGANTILFLLFAKPVRGFWGVLKMDPWWFGLGPPAAIAGP
jgi:hypothetical protein